MSIWRVLSTLKDVLKIFSTTEWDIWSTIYRYFHLVINPHITFNNQAAHNHPYNVTMVLTMYSYHRQWWKGVTHLNYSTAGCSINVYYNDQEVVHLIKAKVLKPPYLISNRTNGLQRIIELDVWTCYYQDRLRNPPFPFIQPLQQLLITTLSLRKYYKLLFFDNLF